MSPGFCSMKNPNIKRFGKSYSYLADPTLRAREIGDSVLTIENAEFSDVNFMDLTWRKVRLVNCDFIGAYETKLERLEQALLENCRFVGIHSFGNMVDVKFLRCQVRGAPFYKGNPIARISSSKSVPSWGTPLSPMNGVLSGAMPKPCFWPARQSGSTCVVTQSSISSIATLRM